MARGCSRTLLAMNRHPDTPLPGVPSRVKGQGVARVGPPHPVGRVRTPKPRVRRPAVARPDPVLRPGQPTCGPRGGRIGDRPSPTKASATPVTTGSSRNRPLSLPRPASGVADQNGARLIRRDGGPGVALVAGDGGPHVVETA